MHQVYPVCNTISNAADILGLSRRRSLTRSTIHMSPAYIMVGFISRNSEKRHEIIRMGKSVWKTAYAVSVALNEGFLNEQIRKYIRTSDNPQTVYTTGILCVSKT